MKAGDALGRGGPVARSLGIGRPTYATIAAMSAAISVNGMIAVQGLGPVGQAAVIAVIFASVAACSATVSVDVLGRSAKAVSDLRSVGASRSSISSALFWSMFAYGAAGSAAGGIGGAAIGSALFPSGTGMGTAGLLGAVVAASVVAVAVGSYAGGRYRWRS